MPYEPLVVSPRVGSFVACHVFGVVKHVGIWVGDAIVELQGSGLIRIVSPERFLKDRSGGTIYVACINKLPIENRGLVEVAINQVYQFRNYTNYSN